MRIITWSNIKSGQIVNFRYLSDNDPHGRSYKRTVLCLDPRYYYKKKSTGRRVQLFIGLELEKFGKARKLNKIALKQLFEIVSNIEDEILGSKTERQRMQDIYQDLKVFLKKYPVFKTYFLRKCRKNRVFLEREITTDRLQIGKVIDEILLAREAKGEI